MFPTPALHHSSHSSTSSLSTIVLDLPFPYRVPKHARFPCPYSSPDEFAIEHQTYTPEEYDRTSIEPPTEEERSCALPGRGERCLVADDEDDEDQEEDMEEDGEEVFEDNAEDDEEPGQDASMMDDEEDTSRDFFRACRLDAGEESDREASPPPFPISSRKRARARPTSTPLSSRKASLSNSAQDSSAPSPTTQRRILWLQSQSDNLPDALKSRLLMLSSFDDSPPASPVFDDGVGSSEGSSVFGSGFGSSPVEMVSGGGGFPFSFSGFAAAGRRLGSDEEQEREEDTKEEDSTSDRHPTFAESEPSSLTSSITITDASSFLITPSQSTHLDLSTSPSPTITTFFDLPNRHALLSREASTFSTISTSSSACTASSVASEDGFQSPSCSSEVSTCYSSDQPHSHRSDDDSETELHQLHLHPSHLHPMSMAGMGLGFGAGGKSLRRFETKEIGQEEDEEEEETDGFRRGSGFGLSRGFRTFEL